MCEFILFRKIGINGFFAQSGFGLKRRQAVITLRPNHEINHRLSTHDFGAFRLGHTAGHTDLQVRFINFKPFVAAQLGIYLFRRFFSDMASVEQNHIRVIGCLGLRIALGSQQFSHTLTVIDIHLAAISFYEQFFILRHSQIP